MNQENNERNESQLNDSGNGGNNEAGNEATWRDDAGTQPAQPVTPPATESFTESTTEAAPQQPRSDAGAPIGEPLNESGTPAGETVRPNAATGEATGTTPPTPEPTPARRTSQAARTQAGVAAAAMRRGEFMQDAAVDGSASNDDRLIALLSYVTQVFIPVVMPIIVLLSESSKRRPFQRYHAVQSLALTLLFVLIAIAASLGALIIQIIPVVGQLVALLLFCLSPIAYLMAAVAMFYYGYQAYQGKRFAIPGLTTFLRDQGWI